MKYDEEWMENLNDRLKIIQIEFDAFLKNRELTDYFDFHRGKNGELKSLHFTKAHALPKEIENAVTEAFIQSKPI